MIQQNPHLLVLHLFLFFYRFLYLSHIDIMNKKSTKDKTTSKENKYELHKLVCPECGHDKNAKKLDDGYICCAYCGMVVLKQNYSLELIDTPGFIKRYKYLYQQKIKSKKVIL